MKKITSIILLLTIISSCLAFSGCVFGISNELVAEIIDDYLIFSGIQSDKTPDEIDREFLGKYGDSVAVYFHTSGAYETPTTEEIAGHTFEYPDSRTIKIWNDGRFYKMPEAYEMGMIDENDVSIIKWRSSFIKFKEPYFIYEEKRNLRKPNGMYNSRWSTTELVVLFDKGISRENKIIDERFFDGINIESMRVGYYEHIERTFCYLTIMNPSNDLDFCVETAISLLEIDGIYYVEISYDGSALIPNDSLYNNTLSLLGEDALDYINVPAVWDFTTGSSDIRVGVLDFGIASHEDLNDNYSIYNAYDFYNINSSEPISGVKNDTNSHGTSIAGIIGAVGNNEEEKL